MRPQEREEPASTQWKMQKTCSMNPLKQKMTMKKNSFLWAALSMTAALVMTACSSDDNMTETPQTPSTSKKIPYTVTVGEATTRATVDANNRTLYFAAGDKLYITGTDIQGVLDLQDGDEGKTTGATFSGELTYSGEGSPADDLALSATLVSAQQTVDTQVSVDANGIVSVNYPTSAYCTSINDAVQQYSKLHGNSTYSAKAFSLTQLTAFLNFVITFEDGTTTGTELSAVVKNGETTLCTANVTTVTEDEKVVAKFVLPVDAGTKLSSATVTMGSKAALAITDKELTGKVYNVKKTQAAPACSYTAPTLVSGTLTYNKSAQTLVTGGSATNATIYYSTNGGSSWSTSVPTGTNAGTYTVHYKVEPADGYTGGVGSTSLGSKTINKANGYVSLSPSSSDGWRTLSKKEATVTVTHHGGSLSSSKSGSGIDNLTVSIIGNTMTLTKKSNVPIQNVTVTVTSAATQNYNVASATYTCNN